MSGNILARDQKILCVRSGGRCAIPECRKEIIIKTPGDRESFIGEMAHIKGEKEGAARFDPNMTDKERNSYDNLILVCGNHHKTIDDQKNTYTVEKLVEIKKQHEEWVRKELSGKVMDVTFAELNVVTKYLVSGQYTPSDSYTIIPPREKIEKNGLSQRTTHMITMGLSQVKQVEEYINKCLDIEFGERLKQGFVNEYERLKNEENLDGDDLFDCLLDFAAGYSNDFKIKAAGLTVLVYLFEKCEVFKD